MNLIYFYFSYIVLLGRVTNITYPYLDMLYNESFSAQKLESEQNLLEYVHWGPNDYQIKPPTPPPATNIFFFKKEKKYFGGFSVKSAIRAKPVGIVSLGSQ